MYEQREACWVLFKNDRKREGKNDADYRGSLTINGEEYWMNAWIKQGKNGKFMSGSIKLKERQQEQKPKPKVVGGRDFDNDIPF